MSELPHLTFSVLNKEGGAGQESGSTARRPSNSTSDKDVGSGALPGAGEEGQEEGQGDQRRSPPQGHFGRDVRRGRDSLLRHRGRRRGGGVIRLQRIYNF